MDIPEIANVFSEMAGYTEDMALQLIVIEAKEGGLYAPWLINDVDWGVEITENGISIHGELMNTISGNSNPLNYANEEIFFGNLQKRFESFAGEIVETFSGRINEALEEHISNTLGGV